MDFFDIGLSEMLEAYVKVESVKAENSFDAYKQAQAQAGALGEAEKTSQSAEAADVTDESRQPPQYVNGINNKVLLIGGGLLLAGVAFVALRSGK